MSKTVLIKKIFRLPTLFILTALIMIGCRLANILEQLKLFEK